MKRPRTTIENCRIQQMLPMSIGYLGGVVEAARFIEYDGRTCVALVRLGVIPIAYRLTLTLQQAVDADIVEPVR